MTDVQSKKHGNTVIQNKKEQDYDAKLLMLQEKYNNLQLRYSALFNLNRLSQECDDLVHFYPQVHSTIRSLMTAENFFIVTYDQTFSTLEFVYYVDEKDEGPVGGLLTIRIMQLLYFFNYRFVPSLY